MCLTTQAVQNRAWEEQLRVLMSHHLLWPWLQKCPGEGQCSGSPGGMYLQTGTSSARWGSPDRAGTATGSPDPKLPEMQQHGLPPCPAPPARCSREGLPQGRLPEHLFSAVAAWCMPLQGLPVCDEWVKCGQNEENSRHLWFLPSHLCPVPARGARLRGAVQPALCCWGASTTRNISPGCWGAAVHRCQWFTCKREVTALQMIWHHCCTRFAASNSSLNSTDEICNTLWLIPARNLTFPLSEKRLFHSQQALSPGLHFFQRAQAIPTVPRISSPARARVATVQSQQPGHECPLPRSPSGYTHIPA